jgi:hypothetical protein
VQLHREYDRIRAAGADLVLIGNGGRQAASAFCEEHGITSPVYVDVARRAYLALGMRRGVRSPIGAVRTVGHAARAWRRGFRQGAVQGDAWQLGGVLVVLPGGRIVYRHLSTEAGDHPPVAEVLAAVERLRQVGEGRPTARRPSRA